MAEDSGTAAPDPRIDAILEHRWPMSPEISGKVQDAHRNHQYTGWCPLCRHDKADSVPKILAVGDAADRAAGVIRVRTDDATVARLAQTLAESGPESFHTYWRVARAVLEALATPPPVD